MRRSPSEVERAILLTTVAEADLGPDNSDRRRVAARINAKTE